jgi:EAL domain-containing protein (putative c-di-GMP-specific phosphodiesterase class I)
MKQADLAMYKSKDSGRNVCRFFDAKMEATVLERATLERELRQAITDGQFQLHYQPQIGPDGDLIGAEALIRWNHPQRGLVAPNEFIPVAEETGLILPLGHWVLEAACRQLALWATRPETAYFKVAVNVSARQFQQADFVEQVIATLQSTGADPARLTLELTESLLIHNVEDVIGKMTELKAEGVSFALDDFGIGYSSLHFLKRLPLDQLKIDRSFVRHVLTDPNDAAIANMIVALAQTLGLEVIAEGIETAEQRDFLASSGCHCYQGYYFSRPRPLESFEEFACQLSDPRRLQESAA